MTVAMDMSSSRRDALVIVNPAAHNVPKRRKLAAVEAWLREQGWAAEWRQTDAPGEATALAAAAAERGVSLVLVCGGDGTLNEAANGLAGSETALAPIPAGTVNVWARETGIPLRPLEAVKAATDGERRRVDLGRAGERYFLLMAGYGLDGAIARRLSHGIKGRVGAGAYAVAAVREALRYRGSPLLLRLDGEERAVEALMLVAANTRNYAGLVDITPQARADDGLLDVCVYEGRGTRDIVLHVV
ncbi:MAG TPA: YegS/Rv2252/BmrU family lipid kinase, partial [Dehalococcoidia bacterium]|nr:YegS/Rv2252/BmrU family lipid kinase [Dehalococcoidia bacterium]